MIAEIVIFCILALVVTLLVISLGRRGPGPLAGFLFFFLIFLLSAWAASAWLVPIGPPFYEVYWAGPLAVALFLGLILLTVIPPAVDRARSEEALRQSLETPSETSTRHAVEFGFNLFFWIAVAGLIAVITASYLYV